MRSPERPDPVDRPALGQLTEQAPDLSHLERLVQLERRQNARQAPGEHRRPRILYLADRNILVDDPKDKTFEPFGDARWKISGEAIKSREMYFATYQAIARGLGDTAIDAIKTMSSLQWRVPRNG